MPESIPDYPEDDPAMRRDLTSHNRLRAVQFTRRLLTDHFTHAKNIYGNMMHPTEVNDLWGMVNKAHGHLNAAEADLSRGGSNWHSHFGQAVDAIGDIDDAWQSREPELPEDGPHWGGDRSNLWGTVHRAAQALYGETFKE